ncbi:hypothetical protein M3O96_00570 [Aquiflexum sp. TKW24L]|uniref:hypothetical protein n=1 Tax=Aquiflexum sp. TKW24L TaxID=2942212 RepID=UPI0020BF5497|nr:hypothetical protein [Aquiflexum sp. TKW24L]MCL6257561.1 hypothetical protein [Aquiflexum sp. TKW24L]
MKSQIKNFLSVFLVAVIGIAGISNPYFFDDRIENNRYEISDSNLISGFDQGLELTSTKISVPVFNALDTVFDFISNASSLQLNIVESGFLKAFWPDKVKSFFCVYTLLFPFHYFW